MSVSLDSIFSIMDSSFNRANSIFNTAWNVGSQIFNWKKQDENLNYQKALQQQIFNREDTAVQRRVNDLEAAGLNKNLAAGSAANSGSVVSTTPAQFGSSPGEFGSMLDALAAKTQIDSQKAMTENYKVQNDVLREQLAGIDKDNYSKVLDNKLKYIDYCNKLGIDVGINPDDPTELYFDRETTQSNDSNYNVHWLNDSPQKLMFNYNLQNGENNASLLQGEADFYKMDKYSGYAGQIMNFLLQIMKMVK